MAREYKGAYITFEQATLLTLQRLLNSVDRTFGSAVLTDLLEWTEDGRTMYFNSYYVPLELAPEGSQRWEW